MTIAFTLLRSENADQGEGVGSYNDWDGDKAYVLSATAYFKPVSTEGRPLREA